ncbi:MAG: CpaB family protein [Pirellulales bacterium]
MRGLNGLLLAVGFGIAGALLNWMYLAQRAQDVEKVEFVGIAPGADPIRIGDVFKAEQLVPIAIPASNVGNLKEVGVYYSDRQTVIGMKATRLYEQDEMLLSQDLKTPPPELKFGPDERVMWIPVDVRTFVPSLVMPGDQVSFLFPKFTAGVPTPVAPAEAPAAGGPPALSPAGEAAAATGSEIIGPFRILSLGNRLGTSNVLQAAGVMANQENVMGIAVKMDGNQLETKARKLSEFMQRNGFRQVEILLHPREKKAG